MNFFTELPSDFRKQIDTVARRYRHDWRFTVARISPQGEVLQRYGTRKTLKSASWREVLQFALEQALQWGEATIVPGPQGQLVWATPLMINAKMIGGLAAWIHEEQTLEANGTIPPQMLQQASVALRQLCEQHNLTNAALLAERRKQYHIEKQRAEAIHLFKADPVGDLRQVYWRQEPELLAAIRRGDPSQSREVLNRMLVVLLHRASQRLELLKSFLMELSASVCRTATEAGADPVAILEDHVQLLRQLESAEDLDAIGRWLHQLLDQVFDRIGERTERRHETIVADALQFMQEHFDQRLGRDDIAQAVHLSPWYFSRLFKQQAGLSVADMLRKIRLNHAAEQLARTDRPISDIAIESGFADQAQLTRLMRRHIGQTPRQYRLQFQVTNDTN